MIGQEINKQIKEQVVSILFNVKSISGIYSSEIVDTSKRRAMFTQDKWQLAVQINWINKWSFNITLNVAVNSNSSVLLTYNLLKNLLFDAFKNILKIKMNTLYLNIIDIQEKRR